MVHALVTGANGFVATHVVDQLITVSAVLLSVLEGFFPSRSLHNATYHREFAPHEL